LARTASEFLFNYVSSYLFMAAKVLSPISYFYYALSSGGEEEVESCEQLKNSPAAGP